MADAKIKLAAFVQQLREELMAAMEAGEGESLRFDLEDVKIEAQVAVTREAEGKGGVKLWVLDAGLAGKLHSSRLQKVTLSLKPKTASGGSVRLAGSR